MLTELTLLQFRSHDRAVLQLDARPVAIFGPNGAGKTNILEAVSMLSPGRGLRRAASEDLMRQGHLVGWKLRATLDGHELETGCLPGQSRTLKLDGKPAAQTVLGHIARILWLVPAMDRLWIEGAEGRRRFLDRMTMSFHPGHADASLVYEKAMRERNRLLKDGVRDRTWYHALEAQMVGAGLDIRANRVDAIARIMAAQAGARTAFPAADLQIANDDAEDLAQALHEGRMQDMAAGRTLQGPHRADLVARYQAKNAPAAQCSTGEQKALLLSLVLANARALEDAPVILLLDEVAAHLDTARRGALYDEICALSAQVFMTATEQALFDSLGARGHYLRVSEADGTSLTQPVP
ncbi:DNA replication/repair protein RecF [Rhodobacteraceae bacterium]|nr:DNA replication/repair protein RecF [Paracoccaceae bacterium]